MFVACGMYMAHAQLRKSPISPWPAFFPRLPTTLRAQPQEASVTGKKVDTVAEPVTRVCGWLEKTVHSDVLVSKVANVHVGGPTAPHVAAHCVGVVAVGCTVPVAAHKLFVF